jgi:hypothetical protein
MGSREGTTSPTGSTKRAVCCGNGYDGGPYCGLSSCRFKSAERDRPNASRATQRCRPESMRKEPHAGRTEKPNCPRSQFHRGVLDDRIAGAARFRTVRHLHCEPGDPATRLDNRGNWATVRNPALGSPAHTCTAHTSCRMASPSARRRIAGRSPESGLNDRNRNSDRSARWRRRPP